jgi:hypothetical protein
MVFPNATGEPYNEMKQNWNGDNDALSTLRGGCI